MAGLVNRQYTLGVNVQEAGSPEQSVNVRAWNIAETSVLDKTTDVNGDVTDTVLTAEEYSLTGNALSAAISEDNAVFTDETTDANSATANDVTLLPTPAAATDRFYVGYSTTFPQVEINVGTAGAGTYTLAWSYWNGSTWAALTVEDGTDNFKNSGWNVVKFTPPGDWATTTVNSQGPFYYIRCTRDAGTQTTQPLGTQLFVTTIATTIRNPFTLRALKWQLQVLNVSINLGSPSSQTLFMSANTIITQTTQLTVQGYTGITFNHTTDTVTLDGTGGTPVNSMDRFYDRAQDEAIVNEQYSPAEVLASLDKQNYTLQYDLVITGFTFNGQNRSIAPVTGKDLTIQGAGGNVSDLTWTGDVVAGALWDATTIDNLDVNGDVDLSAGGTPRTITLDNCQWGSVSSTTSGWTLQLINGSTITTNNNPANITVENNVSLTVSVVDSQDNPAEGVRVRIERTSDGSLIAQGSTNASGVFSDTFNYGGGPDVPVTLKARLKRYRYGRQPGTITSTGLSAGFRLADNTIVDLP